MGEMGKNEQHKPIECAYDVKPERPFIFAMICTILCELLPTFFFPVLTKHNAYANKLVFCEEDTKKRDTNGNGGGTHSQTAKQKRLINST